ncbi:hypothetical protein [Nonomuraea basaltis]|uniref:hypothetical protein n=1 Tax=Nonomuraea basaltis TaxID=2495887 RepID=UPI00110C5BBB|nr:hypothetical protein [Nonomuraea basaltis]TMS00153.1 hypothetical protein EJK15_03515 [Nonomuraea basaltis]
MTPAEVLAKARLAAHESRWGEGSGSLDTFREQAARDVAALAEQGQVIVSAEDVQLLERDVRRLLSINRRLEVRLASARNLCARSPLCVPAALPEETTDEH